MSVKQSCTLYACAVAQTLKNPQIMDYAANLALFLTERTGSCLGRWKGRMSAKEQRAFRDDGDETVAFVAMSNQDGDRVLIGAVNVLHTFIPTQVVRVSMLEVAA